jgi:hypothetical protein
MQVLRAAVLVVVLLALVTAASYGFHRVTNPSFSPRRSSTSSTTTTAPATTTTTAPHPTASLDWKPLGGLVNDRTPLEEAALGPDRVAVWVDQSLVRLQLVPGRVLPGGVGWNPFAEVPAASRPALLAAFNGGFQLTDGRGGFLTQGRTASPLVPGTAALVIRTDGTATVGEWGRDVGLDPSVVAVRQNIVLMVDNGAVTTAVSRAYPYWGYTPTRSVIVWRSAVGIDGDGNLVFIAAANIDPVGLASLLVQAGCVRAMELDINHKFVSFNTYQQTTPGVVHGTRLLSDMFYPGDRYLTPDDRDFIALYQRS